MPSGAIVRTLNTVDKLQRWLKFMANILKVPRIYDYMPFGV